MQVSVCGKQYTSRGDRVEPERWGIKRPQVQEMLADFRRHPAWREDMTVRELDEHVIRDLYRNGRSVAVTVNDRIPVPIDIVIIHCWDEKAGKFLEDVLRATKQVGNDVGLFICFLSQYQGTDEEIDAQVKQGGHTIYDGIFARLLQHISSRETKLVIVIPCDEIVDQNGLYARMWCAWEIFNAIKRQIPVKFYSPGRNGNTLADYLCGRGNVRTDIWKARCGNPSIPLRPGSDEDRIRDALQAKHRLLSSIKLFEAVNLTLNSNLMSIDFMEAKDGPAIIEIKSDKWYIIEHLELTRQGPCGWANMRNLGDEHALRMWPAVILIHFLYQYILTSKMIGDCWRGTVEPTWLAAALGALINIHMYPGPSLKGWYHLIRYRCWLWIGLTVCAHCPQIVTIAVLVFFVTTVAGNLRWKKVCRGLISLLLWLVVKPPTADAFLVDTIILGVATLLWSLEGDFCWFLLLCIMSPYGWLVTDVVGILFTGQIIEDLCWPNSCFFECL